MTMLTPEEITKRLNRLAPPVGTRPVELDRQMAASIGAAYAAAYALTETQAKQIDVLMEAGKLMAKRIGQLEEWQEVSLKMSEETHEVMDVVVSQRDAALASLAEWKAQAALINAKGTDPESWEFVEALAAATPGRGEELLAEHAAMRTALEEIANWPSGGNRYGQTNIMRFAKAALDADGATS